MTYKCIFSLSFMVLFLAACGGTASSDSDDETGSAESTTPPESNPGFEQEMLSAINEARANARLCGTLDMAATQAVTWSQPLTVAAYFHSANMANYNFFSHTDLDGNDFSTRAYTQGYSGSARSENIAAGQTGVVSVMQSWLSSPGHCRNIMDPSVKEVGAAVVNNPNSDYQYYWTQVFGY